MKKSTLSAIAAVSAAGVIALGLGAVTDWYKNWDAKTWFNYWGKGAPVQQPVDPDTPDEPKTKDGAIVTDGVNNGITLTAAKLPRSAYAANGVSAQADTAYTLTATVEPDNANDLTVEWSVAWKNPESAFAKGEDIAVYVTVTSTGMATANLVCNKAFGEPIIVTATSKDNSEAKAICQVDYRKRVLFATGSTIKTNVFATGKTNTYSHDFSDPFCYHMNYTQYDCYADGFTPVPVFQDYTVDDTFTYTVTRELTDTFYDNLKLEIPELKKTAPLSFDNGLGAFDSIQFLRNYGVDVNKLQQSGVQNVVISNLKYIDGAAHEILHVHFESEYSSFDQDFAFRFKPETLVTRVTSVNVDKSSIVI